MITFTETGDSGILKISLELEWLLFKNMCKLFGFRRLPISKDQFIKNINRRKYANSVLRRMDSM
jgi:hypothetical protein